MNIEYKKESILQLIFKVIENNLHICKLSKTNILVTDYKFRLGENMFVDDDEETSVLKYKNPHRDIFFGNERNQTIFTVKNQTQDFAVLAAEIKNLKITVSPVTGTSKCSKTIHRNKFKPHFLFKSIPYEVIERNIISEYEIVFQKIGNRRSKNFTITELEYLTIIETYNRCVKEYELKREESEIQNVSREITHEITSLMDTLNIEKQIL